LFVSIVAVRDDFGNFKQFIASEVPMFTTVGNHEWYEELYSFSAYLNRFDNPKVSGKREVYYSTDIGLVHWIMVAGYCESSKTSSKMPCLDEGTAQRAWLIDDLSKVDRSTTPWVFVVFHQPYMNSNSHHDISSEGKPMQVAIEDILYNGKVDVVFSGHVHAYERSCQSYKYVCTEGAPYYITIGDGGNSEGLALPWNDPQPSWSLYRQASYGFGELTVHNATHASWAWHQNQDLFPTVADSFEFVRGSNKYLQGSSPTTGEAVFTDNVRGVRAAQQNSERALLTNSKFAARRAR
jgi:3',5'-cyclic AMP phosphodiesterase CpdA